jgi:hypothetical protein
MKRFCLLVLSLVIVGTSAVPANAHRLAVRKAKTSTKRLGNAAAKRISKLAGTEVIGRTKVSSRCRAPHASDRHRHVILCTWFLHVQYIATDTNGRLIDGMPINHLTCLADVRSRVGRKPKQNNKTTRCRVRGQPTPRVNHRTPAPDGLRFALPGYDLDKIARDVSRLPAARHRLSVRQALKQRERNALTHSVPRGVRYHLPGSKRLTVRDQRRAYLAAEGAGRVATAIRGNAPKLDTVAHTSMFGNYDGQVAFDAEQQGILNTIDAIYQVEINTLGGAYGYDGTVNIGYIPQGSIFSNLCATDVMSINMFYCPADDSVTLETGLSQYMFTQFGDGAFAGFVAHEFGHGAQRWLGWDDQGALYYELYREGLADCFAGAWYWSAYYDGYLDYGGYNGAIDSSEYVAGLNHLNDLAGGTTVLDSHGDNNWRDSWINYGWNNGFQGCGVLANNWNHNIT